MLFRSTWLAAAAFALMMSASCGDFAIAVEPLTISIEVDRGDDLGQSFGSIFELKSTDGKLTIGAGFENQYNSYLRADRHAVQLYVRSADAAPELTSETLPRPNDVCGAYLVARDGKLHSVTGKLQVWDAASKSWAPDPARQEGMRVGDGLLQWSDGAVTYQGKSILDRPAIGAYTLFFYANGHLCFYHIDRQDRPYRPWTSDADGFSKLYACPWTPADARVDLSQAIVYTLPIVGETTFAWGQFGSQVLTGSNVGGFYVYEGGKWSKRSDPNLSVSFQLYSSLGFQDRLLMGQYPTGHIFSYDGQTLVDQPNWPPVLPGVASHSREAQTTGIYGGYLYAGVWPWGELWRYSPDSKQWTFVRRMFEHPQLSTEITHPYDVENSKNAVSNLWGQRVTSLVTLDGDLYVSTSAKHPCDWDPQSNPFLAPELWKSYGSVYRLNGPGHLSAPVKWTDGPTRLDFIVTEQALTISQDGRVLASTPISGDVSEQIANRLAHSNAWSAATYGQGLYGPFGGREVRPVK